MGWVTAKLAKRRRNRVVLWLVALAFITAITADLSYLFAIRPDWNLFKKPAACKSILIRAYEANKSPTMPALQWKPIAFDTIPLEVKHAVMAAEDVRFYQHSGIDLAAIWDALSKAGRNGRIRSGASTLSQQTIKNVLLGNEHSWLRKWHEALLAWRMEQSLSKDQIFNLYLNVAEFGIGIFGVEAAAQAYWHKPVGSLSKAEAIELAASLPSPQKNNPATKTEPFETRVEKITDFMKQFGW